ncbi:MAG TPA: NAD(P)H-binding protein [Gemmatimonadaceae bacterium]|nr:NAD(P)H-binding protein [Gemmatimonadaceae bacterium]
MQITRMQIVIFGGGAVGDRIAREGLARGHQVTVVMRDPAQFEYAQFAKFDNRLAVVRGDVSDPSSVATVAMGADAVVNAISARSGSSLTAAHALIAGAQRAGVRRVIIVGGAGADAIAQRDALDIYLAEAGALDWTYISPAEAIFPGKRTGTYRVGGDHLLTDANGHSRISYEDYAVAVLDALERRDHVRERITVAY